MFLVLTANSFSGLFAFGFKALCLNSHQFFKLRKVIKSACKFCGCKLAPAALE